MLRRIVTTIALAVVASGALGGVSSADAAYDQEGRRTGTAAADGSYAEITGNGFSARSGQCVLYAALTTDFDGTQRQIESGLVRCNGANLDGTCLDGHAFVERFNGSSYYCQQGYTFTNNTAYDATTYRQSSTSTTFTGHVNGASLTQAGFGLADEVRGLAWVRPLAVPGVRPPAGDDQDLEAVRHELRLVVRDGVDGVERSRRHHRRTLLGRVAGSATGEFYVD